MCCDRVRSKRGPVSGSVTIFYRNTRTAAALCTAVAVDMEAFEDLRRPRRTAQHHGMGQRLCARSPGAAVPAGADSVGCRPVLHGVQAPAPPRLRGAGGSDTRVPQPPRGASRRVRCAHLHACAAAACAAPPRLRGGAAAPLTAPAPGLPHAAGTAWAEYRFVGVNAPNLARIEANSSNPRQTSLPSEAEIWDLLCGAQQLGARVVRMYVLSFCDDGSCHIRSVCRAPLCSLTCALVRIWVAHANVRRLLLPAQQHVGAAVRKRLAPPRLQRGLVPGARHRRCRCQRAGREADHPVH